MSASERLTAGRGRDRRGRAGRRCRGGPAAAVDRRRRGVGLSRVARTERKSRWRDSTSDLIPFPTNESSHRSLDVRRLAGRRGGPRRRSSGRRQRTHDRGSSFSLAVDRPTKRREEPQPIPDHVDRKRWTLWYFSTILEMERYGID